MCSHRGVGGGRMPEAIGAGLGVGFTETSVEGSHVPGSVWPAVVAVCGGRMAEESIAHGVRRHSLPEN